MPQIGPEETVNMVNSVYVLPESLQSICCDFGRFDVVKESWIEREREKCWAVWRNKKKMTAALKGGPMDLLLGRKKRQSLTPFFLLLA